MDLTQHSRDASVSYVGNQKFSVPFGKSLVMETSPEGIDVLNVGPAEGKQWQVTVTVRVVETNAA